MAASYAIYPSIYLGITSGVLAAIYEGEIYMTNIEDASSKLFKLKLFDNEPDVEHSNGTGKKNLIKASFYFSLITSILFSLGSIYLIVETLATLGLIGAPLTLVIGIAIICGASYGLQTFNSLVNLILNDTLSSWWAEAKNSFHEGGLFKRSLITLSNIVLISLAICLTISTAGTWWTIAQQSKNLPIFIRSIPKFISSVITPIFVAISTLIFTLENTKATFDLFLKQFKSKNSHNHSNGNSYAKSSSTNIPIYQTYNPFNFLASIIGISLKGIGIILHVVSIGLTTNRIPGISIQLSVVTSMLSELFEDIPYFFGSEEDNDIPTILINLSLSPLYFLSTAWNLAGSKIIDTSTNQSFNSDEIPVNNWQQRRMISQLNEGGHQRIRFLDKNQAPAVLNKSQTSLSQNSLFFNPSVVKNSGDNESLRAGLSSALVSNN